MLGQGKTVKFVDGGQSASLGSRGFPVRIKCGDIVLDILFGYIIRLGDAMGLKPGDIFIEVGFIGGDGGFGESPFDADMHEELLPQCAESVNAHNSSYYAIVLCRPQRRPRRIRRPTFSAARMRFLGPSAMASFNGMAPGTMPNTASMPTS